MPLTENPAIIASRLKDLLSTIEKSAQELQKYLTDLDAHGSFNSQAEDKLEGAADDIYQKTFIFHKTPQIATQASVLRIACERLAHLVTPPMHRVIEAAGSFYTTVSLQTCVRNSVADNIEKLSKNERGVAIQELADASEIDEDLLEAQSARMLRYLSLHGLFQEVETGKFCNTSATMTLINNVEFKADLDYLMYENRLGGFAMESFMKRRYAARSQQCAITPALSPFELYSGGIPIHEWINLPDNHERRENFSRAMQGIPRAERAAALPLMRAYPFTSLPRGTVVVDVGGGVRYNLAENLLPACPNLMMIVEDLEHVVKSKIDNASPDMKRWVDERRLKFQVHDIFKFHPEYLKGSVFLVNNILYHENDPRALAVLRAIRASSPSRLLIIDSILDPSLNTEPHSTTEAQKACSGLRDPTSPRGTVLTQAEGPVLPPQSQILPSIIDLMVATVGGGKVRTLKEWITLLSHSGFSLSKVYPYKDYRSEGQVVLEAFLV